MVKYNWMYSYLQHTCHVAAVADNTAPTFFVLNSSVLRHDPCYHFIGGFYSWRKKHRKSAKLPHRHNIKLSFWSFVFFSFFSFLFAFLSYGLFFFSFFVFLFCFFFVVLLFCRFVFLSFCLSVYYYFVAVIFWRCVLLKLEVTKRVRQLWSLCATSC